MIGATSTFRSLQPGPLPVRTSSQPHSWPTDLTLEASELPALDLWFAPPLLSSCLLQSCYMIITHGTQQDHTSSSELNRNMFAGALHDNLCGRSGEWWHSSSPAIAGCRDRSTSASPSRLSSPSFCRKSAVSSTGENLLRLRRARGCAVTVDGATWVRALGVLSPHPTGDLPLLDGRRQQAGAPLSRRRRRLPRAAASAVRATLTDPDAHGPS